MHRTGITRGAAVGHTAWAKRVATHPKVLAALAAGQVSESAGRLICLWTGKLPQEHRDAADEQLLAAAAGGPGAGATWRPWSPRCTCGPAGTCPDQDPDREFADREVKLATTIGGAGVLHGDLTAECAAPWPRCWTRWPPRPGKRTTGPRGSGITMRWPRRCAG